MKNLFFIATIFSLSLSFSSCASIMTSSTTKVSINSDPQGAELSIVNKKGKEVYSGKTPAIVKLNNSSGYMSGEMLTVTVSKPGYEEKKVYINSQLEGMYWGNIFLGGLIGFLIIDPLTGAMYKLDTEHIDVSLKEKKDSQEVTLQIIDINTLSEEQKENLVKLN